MTDLELAREVTKELILLYASYPKTFNAQRDAIEDLILASFARTADARRVDHLIAQAYDHKKCDSPETAYLSILRGTPTDGVRSALDAAMGATLGRTGGFLAEMQEGMQDREPASRAVPITPDTEPQYPCWVHHQKSGWHHFSRGGLTTGGWDRLGWTHHHPDQPTPPTCRPTGEAL